MPSMGWSGAGAGIGRPQRPAIHRMEEEIQEEGGHEYPQNSIDQ